LQVPSLPPTYNVNQIQNSKVTYLPPYFTQLESAGVIANKFAFYTLRSMVSNGPDPGNATNIDELRTDTEELLDQLHWLYTSEPVQEAQRTWLLVSLWALLRILGRPGGFPLLLLVVVAGALGGSFSSLLGLQRTSLEGNAVVNLWTFNLMGVSAIIAPFIGSLSAVVLMFLFAANLLSGQLLPRGEILASSSLVVGTNSIGAVAPVGAGGSNLMAAATNLHSGETNKAVASSKPAIGTNEQASGNEPKPNSEPRPTHSGWPFHIRVDNDSSSLAKLLIWSFVAGFSERLVPDIIDRLAEKAKNQ
jgi:hypothetical protein